MPSGYNAAGQIVSRSGAHGAYAWQAGVNGSTGSTVNGLNQLTSHGQATVTHDGRGNLISDGTRSFSYTSENRLATAPGTVQYYDPLGRLIHLSASGTDFRYDDNTIIEDSPAHGVIRRRYVHGPGVDEPLVWYEGAGTTDRRWLHADERGSITAVSDGAGNAIAYNAYDEYGRSQPWGNPGRFGYTGQAWLPEIGVSYHRARMYDADLGRFLQADPVGYGEGQRQFVSEGRKAVEQGRQAGGSVIGVGSCRAVAAGEAGAPSEVVMRIRGAAARAEPENWPAPALAN